MPSECGPCSRHFQTFHHPTYGSCYTFNGMWTAQRPGITHGECQPGPRGDRVLPGLASPPASLLQGSAWSSGLSSRTPSRCCPPRPASRSWSTSGTTRRSWSTGASASGRGRRPPSASERCGARGAGRGGPQPPRHWSEGEGGWVELNPLPAGRGAPAREPLQPLHGRRGGRGRPAAVQRHLHHAGAPGLGWGRGKGLREGGAGEREVNRPAGRQALGEGWLLPHTPPGDPSPGALLSPQACLVSCFQQLMVNTCSCGYYFYPLPAGAEYCSSARHPSWGEPAPSTAPPPRPQPRPAHLRGAAHLCATPGSPLTGSPVTPPPQATASTASTENWRPTGFPAPLDAPGPAGEWGVLGSGVTALGTTEGV